MYDIPDETSDPMVLCAMNRGDEDWEELLVEDRYLVDGCSRAKVWEPDRLGEAETF